MHLLRVNLGGEGEVPGAINQQPEWVLMTTSWRSTTDKTIDELIASGIPFVFCPNDKLSFEDGSVEEVYTNSVKIGGGSHYGPWVPESEIWRILTNGGKWYHDGILRWVKPWVVSLS